MGLNTMKINIVPTKNTLLMIFSLYILSCVQLNANETSLDEGIPQSNEINTQIKPFGHSLFESSNSSRGASGSDPNYIVGPGDKVSLHIWGAIQADEVSIIDTQGNLFIPEVGAVNASGTKANQLQAVVQQKLRSVYKDGVDAYVTLLTGNPINIFITGPVSKPGQFTGSQSDSIISLLQKAGGILSNQGSYRNIKVLRNSRPIATIDLYQFLRYGQLPKIQFQNRDTILVEPQNPIATVLGDARNNYTFEFSRNITFGRDLITIARPHSSATNVAISGSRNQRPWSAYLSLKEFKKVRLSDGDIVRFVTDSPSQTIDIAIEGSHLGNSFFAAKRGTRLLEILDYVAVSPDEADIGNIYIKRKSTAIKQRKNLLDSINRLERSVLTSPARSDAEAAIRKQESALISEFIQNARKIEPDGRIVVSENANISNIRLEDGDIIVIPHRSDIVIVSGEVNIPQAVVYATNATLEDYIIRAGDFTERANRESIVIRKPNGQIVTYGNILPGDELIITPKIETKNFQFAKDMLGIIFQIAATSKAVGIF